jgi:protein-histidine pros-kinase
MRLPGPLTADQERQLKTIQSSAKHQLALITDLLDLATVGSGRMELKPEWVACRDLVDQVLASMRSLAEEKGIVLKPSLLEIDIAVHVDRRTLTQILINLVGNAIKFTDRGSILLKLEQTSGPITKFSVSDTGIGIAADEQAKVFSAFGKLRGDESREGTGLGLHLSQELAKRLGGRIEFVSEYGKGSTFTLILGA